jgi:FkbM family methyltransferase
MTRTKGIVLVAVLGAGAVAAGAFYPPVRLGAMKVVGRSPVCPMRNALRADFNLRLQIRYKDDILRASKLLEKDAQGFQFFDTPYGTWWIPAGNQYVLPFNLAEQERDIYSGGDSGVGSGDIVLDCGANVGTFTRLALKRGAKQVVAFEPAPENIECYRRNFREEIAAGRVVLLPKGVWDKEDVLTLRRDPTNSAADSFVMLSDTAGNVQAPLTTIDRVVEELKLERVDYIKMDVEGAETRAIAGAANTIARYHPRLSIATEHKPTDQVEIPAAVRSAWPGYTMTCGPCLETTDGHIRPDVLYFR